MQEGCPKCNEPLSTACPMHGRGCQGCGCAYDIVYCQTCDVIACVTCQKAMRPFCKVHLYNCFPNCTHANKTDGICFDCKKRSCNKTGYIPVDHTYCEYKRDFEHETRVHVPNKNVAERTGCEYIDADNELGGVWLRIPKGVCVACKMDECPFH